MEYFINVYALNNKQSTIFPDAFYDKEQAIKDVQLEAPRHDIKYIHTIRVIDDQAIVIDLRGEKP